MLNKVKSLKGRLLKWFVTAMAVMSIAAMSCMTCFATGEESSTVDFSSTLTSSFNTLKNDIFIYIGIVLPIALGIVAAFFGIKKAISFFKSTAK